jgi:PTH1 family peptidyl-tRNA hydrolase
MADIFDLFKQIAKKEESQPSPITHIVVGLGNTGDKYFNTRHNAGFLAIDYFSQTLNVRIDRAKFHSLCAEAQLGSHRVLLMKPQTLMNASGTAVGEAAAFYKIAPENIIVISDDIAQAPARIRVRKKGSAGGHNGLKDIIACLGTDAFPRLRIGVGEKAHPDYDLAAWVLSEFPKAEMEKLSATFPCIKGGIEKILGGKFDEAVQFCNSFRVE